MEPRHVALLLVAAIVAAGVVLSFYPEGGDSIGDAGSEHLHAHLFFHINGSEKEMNASYIERDGRAHFHDSDGIIHVHARNVDLEYALETLSVAVNETCLEFRLDSQTLCGAEDDVGITINGETVGIASALDRAIQQGDTIIVWYGSAPEGGYPEQLPPEYREAVPGRRV